MYLNDIYGVSGNGQFQCLKAYFAVQSIAYFTMYVKR